MGDKELQRRFESNVPGALANQLKNKNKRSLTINGRKLYIRINIRMKDDFFIYPWVKRQTFF